MAINFGILQPIDIAGQIASGRQEAQRNQLAQQQLSMGGLQQQKAQLELGDFQRRQAGLDSFIQKSRAAKKSGSEEDMLNSYEEYGLEVGDPQHIMNAQELRLAFNERQRFNQGQMGGQPQPVTAAPAAVAGPSAPIDEAMTLDYVKNAPAGVTYEDFAASQNTGVTKPVTANAPFVDARNLLAPGVALPPAASAANQLAPAPVETVNQLAAPATRSPADIQARIKYLDQFPRVAAAKAESARLTKELEESRKLYTVGGNLVTGAGKSIFTAKEKITPTEIKRLIAERDALLPTDPNRKLYDQAIANLGSTERLAQERLSFFAWEKANPGYTIQQAEDGSIVGVNNRTLQAFPVTLNAAAPPPTAPFTGAASAGKTVAAATTQPIIQPQGEPLKGKSAGLTESQGNATAFGMRMKDSHSLLKSFEGKGETGTGVIGGTVGGVVGLVPLIGDKLTSGVDNIYNVLPSVLGGYSPEQQQVLNGRINFITAVLRKESGAAISPGEFVTAEKLYFPRPGDSSTVVKQKQNARELAIKAMEVQAGPGAKSIQSLTPGTSGATSASDPLGFFE